MPLLAPPATIRAQTLHLEPSPVPVLPDDNALSRLRARLGEGIADHTSRLESARAAGDPDWSLAASISLATSALALRMLADDSTLTGARSIRTAQAMTLADLATSIDSLAGAYADLAFQSRGDPSSPATLELGARAETARAALGAFLRALATDPDAPTEIRGLPPTAHDLDRFLFEAFDELRPALGAITGESPAIEPAWPPSSGAPAPSADAIALARRASEASGSLAPSESGAVAQTIDALAQAERLPIHRRSARAAALRLREAIEAADLLSGVEWLGDRRAEVGAAIAEAAPRLLDRTTRSGAARALDDVRRLGRVVGHVGALESRRVNTLAARRATGVVFARILDAERGARGPDDPNANLLGALERTLGVAAARPDVPPDHFESPGVRRAWRLIERDYGQTERRALDALDEIVRDPRRLTSPDMISLLKKHRDRAEDLRRVASIPAWEAQLRARPSDGATDGALIDNLAIEQSIRAGAADRLAALLGALARDDVRDRALVAIAEFEEHWSRFATLPGETLLARADPAGVAVTDGRAEEALAAMRRDRQEWLAAWAAWRLEETEPPLGRLDAEARIGRAIEVCVALSDPDALDALDRWAAVELSRAGVGAGRRRAKETTGAMVDAMLAGDWAGVDGLLERWDESSATARLLARLVEATDRPDWPAHTGVASLIAQLGSGVPLEAWGRDRRVELAELSRWLGEAGVAEDRGDEALGESILVHLDALSRRILESLFAE